MRAFLATLILTVAAARAGAQFPNDPQRADEKHLKDALFGYVEAYNNHDLQTILQYWMPDGDYVQGGQVHRGKAALANYYREQWGTAPDIKARAHVRRVRFTDNNVAEQEGVAETFSGPTRGENPFIAEWVRQNGVWRIQRLNMLQGQQ